VRTNCFPERIDSDNVTQAECESRECCYQVCNLPKAYCDQVSRFGYVRLGKVELGKVRVRVRLGQFRIG
jgi:hypothetical protein